jgi:hypothetical protein
MPHQVVGEGTLFRDIAHEHRDRASHRLIDVNNEDFVVVAEENRAAAARGQDRTDLDLDDRLVHPRKPYQSGHERQAAQRAARIILLLILLPLLIFSSGQGRSQEREKDQGHEQEFTAIKIFAMRACMSAAVIDYALCGCGRTRKNEDRVGR